MTMTVQDVELKVTVRILEGERKILAQLPQRSNYTKEELKRVVCWVYADAVWRKDVRHQPIMLIELNSGELLWTYPVNAPCVHIRWDGCWTRCIHRLNETTGSTSGKEK